MTPSVINNVNDMGSHRLRTFNIPRLFYFGLMMAHCGRNVLPII